MSDQTGTPLVDIEPKSTSIPDEKGSKIQAENAFSLPRDLAQLTAENVNQISLIGSIYSQVPPYYVVSPDGRFLATAGSNLLTILELSTGKAVTQIEVEIPDCAYGFGRYFQFNPDGSFIAVITKSSIQVWQVGGGLIYEKQHTRFFGNSDPSCGFDIPQIAISPNGRFLAESGIDYSVAEPRRYFRVTDIISNEILYEWNHNDDSPHGGLIGFDGLGFSADGAFFQTFDQKGFFLENGYLNKAFRFWSTDTWEESNDLMKIRESFEPGELLFPISKDGKIAIYDKLNGKAVAEISQPGCEWDSPCEVHFSSDGGKAISLARTDSSLQYRRTTLFTSINIWDLKNEQDLETIHGLFYNLDGIMIENNGEVIGMPTGDLAESTIPDWWILPDYFQGLVSAEKNKISFVPTWMGVNLAQGCQFCATCSLDITQGKIECLPGLENPGSLYAIQKEENDYWVVKYYPDGEAMVGKISLQLEEDDADQRIRLLGFSEEYQTAFYCLDSAFRQQMCVIDDLGESMIVEEMDDISYVRFSPDEKTAAFIDRSMSALFLYDLDAQKLTKKSHYQAKAAKINPVFSSDGQALYYLVQSLKDARDFSVEIMDITSQKIERRISLDAEVELPVAFSVNETGGIWAVATESGEIYIFDPQKGDLLRKWDSGRDQLIGLSFDQQDDLLVSLDATGLFQIWGVIK